MRGVAIDFPLVSPIARAGSGYGREKVVPVVLGTGSDTRHEGEHDLSARSKPIRLTLDQPHLLELVEVAREGLALLGCISLSQARGQCRQIGPSNEVVGGQRQDN